MGGDAGHRRQPEGNRWCVCVRVDGPSVIPFPFKLLREYMRMAERPHGGIDFGGFDFGV